MATALAISAAIAVSARHWLTQDLHEHASAVAQSLARGLVVHMSRDDVWESFEAVRAVASVGGSGRRCDVVVLDRDNRVFVSSNPSRFGVRETVAVLSPPLTSALGLSVQAGSSVVLRMDDRQEAYSVVKMPLLSADREPIGTLLMSYPHSVFAERYSDTLKTLAGITAALIVFFIPMGWWLGHRLASPVTRVTDALYQLGEEASRRNPTMMADTSGTNRPLRTNASEIERLEHALGQLQGQLQEKEQLQREFIAADRLAAIGRMTSGVAHEVNNPLAGMLNALSNLRREPSLLPKTIALLERGLEQIHQTVSALLIETKTGSRPLSPSDIEDLRLLVLTQAHRKQLEVLWTYPVEVELPVSAAPMRQVLLNLLLNAIQAAERVVVFEATATAATLELTVANDGLGFPQEKHEQLFQPFVGDGHGLGLWASHQLVTSLGGSMQLITDGPW